MIFVTGSSGLVGSHLLFHLTSRGEKIRALLHNKSKIENIHHTFSYYTKEPEKLLAQINWVEGDLNDIGFLDEVLTGVTQLYHTAAYVSFNPRLAYKIFDTNVKGTANIVNICLEKKIQKLCHVSSIAALGLPENGQPITENILWKPSKRISAYSLSKYQAEMEVWRGITEGLNAVIINPSVILGPGDWTKGSPALFKFLAKGIKYYTEGINGFVDVNNVAEAMIKAMESNITSERFTVSSENLSYREILNYFSEAFNLEKPRTKANPAILSILQKMEYIRSLVLNCEPRLTRDTVAIVQKKSLYSNQKSINQLNMSYKSINTSITEISSIFNSEKQLWLKTKIS